MSGHLHPGRQVGVVEEDRPVLVAHLRTGHDVEVGADPVAQHRALHADDPEWVAAFYGVDDDDDGNPELIEAMRAAEAKVRTCRSCGVVCDMRVQVCECGPDCPEIPVSR